MLTQATYTSSEAALTAAYEAEYGDGTAAAIPWEQILAILMDLLGGCFMPMTPARLRGAVTEYPRYLKFSMIRALGVVGYRRHNGDGICRAVVNGVTNADDGLLASIVAESDLNS